MRLCVFEEVGAGKLRSRVRMILIDKVLPQEHIKNMKQYLVDIEQYTSFMEQKRTVEQVILAFAPDEEGGREMVCASACPHGVW